MVQLAEISTSFTHMRSIKPGKDVYRFMLCLQASMLEIYNEEYKDLLTKSKKDDKKHNVRICAWQCSMFHIYVECNGLCFRGPGGQAGGTCMPCQVMGVYCVTCRMTI